MSRELYRNQLTNSAANNQLDSTIYYKIDIHNKAAYPYTYSARDIKENYKIIAQIFMDL